jgi:hypothetical protein
MVVPLGVKLISAAPFGVEEAVHGKGSLSLAPGVDGPGQVMGQERQGVSCAGFFLYAAEACLSLGMLPPEEDGRFGERPRERRLADFCP